MSKYRRYNYGRYSVIDGISVLSSVLIYIYYVVFIATIVVAIIFAARHWG